MKHKVKNNVFSDPQPEPTGSHVSVDSKHKQHLFMYLLEGRDGATNKGCSNLWLRHSMERVDEPQQKACLYAC